MKFKQFVLHALKGLFWDVAFPLISAKGVDPKKYEKMTMRQAVKFCAEHRLLMTSSILC